MRVVAAVVVLAASFLLLLRYVLLPACAHLLPSCSYLRVFFFAALVGPAVFCTSFLAAAVVGDLRLTALCWFDAVLLVVICVRLFAAVLGFAVNITCY